MIGDFIIKNYVESKIRILQGKDTELDSINVEITETLFSQPTEFDVKTMLEEIEIPKLDARIPESYD